MQKAQNLLDFQLIIPVNCATEVSGWFGGVYVVSENIKHTLIKDISIPGYISSPAAYGRLVIKYRSYSTNVHTIIISTLDVRDTEKGCFILKELKEEHSKSWFGVARVVVIHRRLEEDDVDCLK